MAQRSPKARIGGNHYLWHSNCLFSFGGLLSPNKDSLNNNCVFWGVEAPVRQGAKRGAYSLYATLFATQPGGMDRRSNQVVIVERALSPLSHGVPHFTLPSLNRRSQCLISTPVNS